MFDHQDLKYTGIIVKYPFKLPLEAQILEKRHAKERKYLQKIRYTSTSVLNKYKWDISKQRIVLL